MLLRTISVRSGSIATSNHVRSDGSLLQHGKAHNCRTLPTDTSKVDNM